MRQQLPSSPAADPFRGQSTIAGSPIVGSRGRSMPTRFTRFGLTRFGLTRFGPFLICSVVLGGFGMAFFQPVPIAEDDDESNKFATCQQAASTLATDAAAFGEPTELPASATAGCTLTVLVEEHAQTTLLSLHQVGSAGTLHTSTAVPNADGLHRFTDLVPGTYHLTASAPQKALASSPVFVCTGDEERTFQTVRFSATAVRLSGRVLGFRGLAPNGAEVLVQQPVGHRDGLAGVVHLPVAADGTFDVLLPAGRHTLLATAPHHRARRQEMTLRTHSATELRLQHQPEVKGVVVDAKGRPVAYAEVFASVGTDPKEGALMTVADAQGHFSLAVHARSALTLSAKKGRQFGSKRLARIRTLEGKNGIKITTQTGRSVGGFVQTRSGRVKPHAKVRYRVRSHGLDGIVLADAEGRFVVEGMPSADVDLWAEGTAIGAWGAAVATKTQPKVLLTFVATAYKRR